MRVSYLFELESQTPTAELSISQPGMVEVYNLRIWKAKSKGPQIQGQPGLRPDKNQTKTKKKTKGVNFSIKDKNG